MNISFRIAIILIMLFAIIAPRCAHAVSDFAGQGKAPLTWNELMNPRVDPSRYFATPGGGHGVHPAGGYDAPQAVAKADKAETVKPDTKPPMPHIPLVPAPKPKPEVKPEVKPGPKPQPEVKPDCKPETHKCWPFKFRPVCTPKVKPDKKPSCKKDVGHKKSECAKSSGDKPGCKPAGMHGHGFGFGRHGHGAGKGAGHGHGR